MLLEKRIKIEGILYDVVISDIPEALLAAKAAGRVIVGVAGPGESSLPMAQYVVEDLAAVSRQYLERVVRREKGMPWWIGETRRLWLREFTVEDAWQVPREPKDGEADRIFYEADKLKAYIQGQYEFFEYGLWAVVRKEDGKIIGKAGITRCDDKGQMELGYHIFQTYRRQGYGEEACRAVLEYVRAEYGCPIYAVSEAANHASGKLLEKLGFTLLDQRYSGPEHRYYLCASC